MSANPEVQKIANAYDPGFDKPDAVMQPPTPEKRAYESSLQNLN